MGKKKRIKSSQAAGVFTTSLSFTNSTANESMIVRSIDPSETGLSADEKLVRIISINKVTR